MTVDTDAPDFTLPGLDGLRYALHEARGKGPVLLMFWHSQCGACERGVAYFNRLYDAYENLGWSFWAIAQDGPDDARRFVGEHGLRPTVLVDGPELRVSDAYDPDAVPAFFLIEPTEGVTVESVGLEKAALNDISRRVAGYTGSPYVEIAPADDGLPAFTPGCGGLQS
jgi:peroxiredoxin